MFRTSAKRSIEAQLVLASAAACLVWLLLMPNFRMESLRNQRLAVSLNNIDVGVLSSREEALSCLRAARRSFAAERIRDGSFDDALALSDAELTLTNAMARTDTAADLTDPEVVTEAMLSVLSGNVHATLGKHYTVKINEYSVNLADAEDVLALLDASLAVYDPEDRYRAELIQDPDREVNVLTAQVVRREEADAAPEELFPAGGTFRAQISVPGETVQDPESMDFSEFDLGLFDMDFNDKIEIVEAYLPDHELTDTDTAIAEVTKDRETPTIYEVKSGDTLSEIARDHGLTVDDLISMNGTLENADSTIRPEDEIIVTVPEPELAVRYETEEYLEESYESEPVIVPRDDWYTTKSVTVQEPSSGYRKIIARTTYVNATEVARDIVKQEVTFEAVPKIIERGTKVPPTYIKPISGGRMTSGFGKRSRPTRGASTYHKGVDWATPVGTAVVASAPGVVTRAGWGSGYGYVIYIRHADGKETRYGHLSKILVKSGQSVSQGQKIALSGNTGVSTGPHIHFEILVGGSQVNPLKYVN